MAKIKAFSVDEAVRGYLPLMHELAIRIDLVAHACEGRLNLAPPFAREYAYLQFRRVCELIALGCLQLHGDLSQTQRPAARKEWNADKIMQLLHREYPHAFPQSAIRERSAKGLEIRANRKPNALTRQEFRKLYAECGEVLHRGTIRSLELSSFLKDADYHKVLEWQRKIVDLMNEHLITRSKGTGFYLVSLRTPSGFPECSIFSKNPSGGFDVSIQRMSA